MIALAGAAFGGWAIALALMAPKEVRCGVTPYTLTLGAAFGLFGVVLSALAWRAPRGKRMLWLAGFAGSLTLLLLWTWRLGPDCPFLSR